MNIQRAGFAPQRLKFPGNIVGATPAAAPTIADVMAKLSQVQQNQSQILDAITKTQINQLSMCIMIGQMFEITSAKPNIALALHQDTQSTAQSIIRNIT